MRNWLRNIRKNEGYKSCEEAALKIGRISCSHYTSIENGSRNPKIETAKRISKRLNFSKYNINWTIFFEE